jgi:aspartate aminotransferase
VYGACDISAPLEQALQSNTALAHFGIPPNWLPTPANRTPLPDERTRSTCTGESAHGLIAICLMVSDNQYVQPKPMEPPPMFPLNSHVTGITESFTIAFADRVRRLKASGRSIIALQTGDPDFATPTAIVEAAAEAMRSGLTHYGDSRGMLALRQAIASKLEAANGIQYGPQREILATHGAIHAYYCALQSILNAGDEVLVPDPTWQTHRNMVGILGGRAVRVPSASEEGFMPSITAWERALTPRTVALVINTPANPTGTVASRDYLLALNALAEKRGLYVVSDEVYQNLLYDGHQHTSFASLPGAKERTLLVNSLSKTYAMTGWRVGYLCAPDSVIDQALKVSQHSITNLAPFVQQAAIVALTDPGVAEETRKMVQAYAHRRDMVVQLWREFGSTPIRVQPPQGAFYFFLDIRELRRPSAEVSERLLEEPGVAVVPGSAYGECGEGFLRMTIAAAEEDIKAGFEAILRWAAAQ